MYSLCRSFRPALLVGFREAYQILYAPLARFDASGHSRRHAKCVMDFNEVVGQIFNATAAA
jgi:hypothetical protein